MLSVCQELVWVPLLVTVTKHPTKASMDKEFILLVV